MKNPSIHVITFGCKVNQKDSEDWIQWFRAKGGEINKDNPDIVLVNTCTVTDKADREAVSVIKKIKQKDPNIIIILTGCGVQKEANYFSSMKEVDYIVPNLSSSQSIEHLFTAEKPLVITPQRTHKTRAFIKIQEGCDNYCGYCIVPYVRGKSRYRKETSIIEEILQKENEGYKEIVLTGINIGAYGASHTRKPRESRLASLLEGILKKTTIPRIRLSSLGPEYFHSELLNVFTNPRLCNHIHLSLQSGSNAVLQNMKRPYTRENVEKLVSDITGKIPLVAFTADIIVGYPGETEEDFQETYDMARLIPLSKIHVFPYSLRDGTAAAIMSCQISQKIKIARAKKLRMLSEQLQQKGRKKLVHQTLSVLFEQKTTHPYTGWSTNYFEVKVQNENSLQGTIQQVYIVRQTEKYVEGVIKKYA